MAEIAEKFRQFEGIRNVEGVVADTKRCSKLALSCDDDVRRYRKPRLPKYVRAALSLCVGFQCRALIDPEYLLAALEKADHIFVVLGDADAQAAYELMMEGRFPMKKRYHTRHACGFALVQEPKKGRTDALNLDIICSSNRVGGKLLKAVETFVRNKHRDVLNLSAINAAISWYRNKQGFVFGTSACKNPKGAKSPSAARRRNLDGVPMSLCVRKERYAKGVKKSKPKPRTKRTKRSKPKAK